jgi:hypothetical protein
MLMPSRCCLGCKSFHPIHRCHISKSPIVCNPSSYVILPFTVTPLADSLAVLYRFQFVRDQLRSVQKPALTVLWPCPALRKYVICPVHCKTYFHALVILSCLQFVSDLLCSPQNPALTLSGPCPALRKCVICSLRCQTPR